MRGSWWALVLLAAVACSKDQDGTGDDTADDTGDDTGTDTDTDTDTDTEEPPEPVTYGDHEGITYELTQPLEWVPLTWTQELTSGTVSSYDYSFAVGANVTGRTDLTLKTDSHLVEASPPTGPWQQHMTGVKDGGLLEAEMEINFPITLTIDTLTLDISSLIGPSVGLPELEKTFDPHVFDTLALIGDSEETTFVASSFAYDWDSGVMDPASWAPYVQITFDMDINYSALFDVVSYDLYPRSNTTKIASQTTAAGRIDVDTHVGAPGEEVTQARFDSIARGELRNDLLIDATITLHMWYNSIPVDITLPFDLDIPIGDSSKATVTFTKEAVTHDQVP